MAIVETRNLTKVFKRGNVGAVVDVNVQTREGEFLVLLGPSGSGKTTLLRMIAGLEDPTSGEILIGGQVVNELTPRERRIAMVFQSYALYPHLTVYKNIVFPLKAQGVPKEKQRTQAEWAAGMLGIKHLFARKPRELSGGERQRVALARAIVREPSVFLLDEPLSNLDAKLRASAREEIEQFQKRIGTTAIYVTHDQVEAMAMGDRVVVMNLGSVQQIGTPAEVYDDPANTFVATFLGSPPMNIVPADGVLVGFRPEHFLPAGVAERGGEHVRYQFRITHSEYLGAEKILYGMIEGGPLNNQKVISRIPSTHSEGLADGSVHLFSVAHSDLKYFDPQSGKRTAERRLLT
ncbi:MAG TPA: ABC transporter ATP-binding protein [Thermoanaerobaculia bacterium]|nr:ABC transporter ATP-binding protein [Thermoanaerobaculia bacterium]